MTSWPQLVEGWSTPTANEGAAAVRVHDQDSLGIWAYLTGHTEWCVRDWRC